MFDHTLLQLSRTLQQRLRRLKDYCQEFRVYDLGSVAINRLTPSRGFQSKLNQAYGLKSRQRLDLYLSTQKPVQGKARPLIVFVHGGAWAHGDKRDYRFVGEAFTRFGYDVAVMNYHLAPQHKFPVYVDDLAQALTYLDQQQHKLGISTARIALMGHSAGAFNIASLLYHPARIALPIRKQIRTLIGIAGPYHFDYVGDALAEPAFQTDVPYQQVMPYYFVEDNDIQHYLFIAENDSIVEAKNSLDLQQKLLEMGNHCEMTVIPKTGHVTIMGSISSLFSRFYRTRSEIVRVLDRAMKED